MFPGMLNYKYNALKMFKVFYILIKYQWALKGQEGEGDLSRPICDPILKKLEGSTKDRSAY